MMADRDLSVSSKHRRWLALVFLAFAFAVSFVVHAHQLVTGSDSRTSGGVLVGVASGLVVIGLVVGFIGRARFGQNAINRNLTLIFMMTIVFQFIHRFVSWRQGLDSRAVLPGDMMITATTSFAAGALVVRAWTYPAIFAGVCALLCVPFPGLTEILYFVSMTSVIATVGFTWQDEKR